MIITDYNWSSLVIIDSNQQILRIWSKATQLRSLADFIGWGPQMAPKKICRRWRIHGRHERKANLVGGDWLPWILYFPILIGNVIIIPINELHHFSEGWVYNHQPVTQRHEMMESDGIWWNMLQICRSSDLRRFILFSGQGNMMSRQFHRILQRLHLRTPFICGKFIATHS